MAKLLYYLASAAYFTADSHQPQLHTQTSFFQVLLLLDLSHSFFSFSAIHHLPFLYLHVCMCAELLQLCPTLCDPMDCSPPGSSIHGDSTGQNIRVGCHALLHGIFPTQGSNPGLPHCRQILYYLSHQGSPLRQEVIKTER